MIELIDKPSAPAPSECCESGCEPCVWDVYREDMAKWKANQAELRELLSVSDSEKQLQALNADNLAKWIIDTNHLKKTFKFADFKTAMAFMNSVAETAEKLDHHPDWCNSYNIVTIKLSTHSSDGLTHLDFVLAREMDNIAATVKS